MKLAKQILAVGLTAVLLAAALPSCTPTGTAELTIDPAARHQTLESFGISSAWWSQDVGGWTDKDANGVPVREAVMELLKNRDGLMLGICNGFQALVKLGLVPFGEIMDMTDVSPTLTFNTIARHQSMLVRTRIASNKSPWLYGTEVDDVHTVAISHGEGRFVAPPELLADMAKNGQIATQYVDMDGNPTMDIHFNPNTSMMAIEGITSPDGRVLGKMGHSERIGQNLYQNVPGEKDQKIFESGVAYFK